MLLLERIAELDPRALVIDTNISQLESAAIELRNPVADAAIRLGGMLEGYPSRTAVDAMFSSFGWKYEYLDWKQRGLAEEPQMLDYRQGKRVSVVVDCDRQGLPANERARAVQLVFDNQRDRRSRWLTITQTAAQFGVTPQALNTWVRKAERSRN